MIEDNLAARFAAAREEFDAGILRKYRRGKGSAELHEVEIAGIIDRKEKFDKLTESDPELYLLHRCANISAAWLSLLSGAILEDLGEADEAIRATEEQIAALAFFSRLANDLWAIIELVETGFDLQARALTRSYLEHVDVLICCIHDKEITKKFVDAVEPAEANKFWHAYISKNKSKSKVSKFIAKIIGLERSDIVDKLREDAESAGSSLLHPTIMAGLSTAFGNEDGDYDSYPVFPTPLAASGGVFRSILIHLTWLWFAMGALPKVGHGDWPPIVRTDRLLDNEAIDAMSALFREMVGFLLDHQLLMRVVEGEADVKMSS